MLNHSEKYIQVKWPAATNVKALVSTRQSGQSQGVYRSFNLAKHVKDEQKYVLQNRLDLQKELNFSEQPFWLQQVHGNVCVPWQKSNVLVEADASFSINKNQICCVMTADCLPILISSKQGDWIAACHAGWRGLLAGVIQNTLDCYIKNTSKKNKSDLIAWIGPAISQTHFEVGEEVRDLFVKQNADYASDFIKNEKQGYQFNFISVAKKILNSYGIDTYGGDLCSYSDDKRFYSYRRDGETGRMASLIWLD